jgi:hypothetical protein
MRKFLALTVLLVLLGSSMGCECGGLFHRGALFPRRAQEEPCCCESCAPGCPCDAAPCGAAPCATGGCCGGGAAPAVMPTITPTPEPTYGAPSSTYNTPGPLPPQ